LCDPWIKPWLGHKLINFEDFKSNQSFFFRLFKEKKLEGKFVLSFTTKVMGYFSLKKNRTKKSTKAIKELEKNSKGKSEEAKEVCNSN
jgi:hypothetical protein